MNAVIKANTKLNMAIRKLHKQREQARAYREQENEAWDEEEDDDSDDDSPLTPAQRLPYLEYKFDQLAQEIDSVESTLNRRLLYVGAGVSVLVLCAVLFAVTKC